MIFTLMFVSEAKKKLFTVACSVLIVIFMLAVPVNNHRLEVISFDVQNADAFLVKTPNNKYFMIDTGKAPYNGGKSQADVIILKYLKDRGIKKLEGLIVTHYDNDHSGGAVDLMNNLKIKKVYLNSEPEKGNTSKLIKETLLRNNIDYQITPNANVIYDFKDVKLTLYKPDGKTDNESSVISMLSYGDFSMLFMGDGGVEAYQNISSYLNNKDIDVLKVGHHGARGVVNDKMISEILPEVSLISTGRNTFGHPNQATLDMLRKTDIYRTDRNNSIKISVAKNKYDILTYDKDAHRYRKFKTYLLNRIKQENNQAVSL